MFALAASMMVKGAVEPVMCARMWCLCCVLQVGYCQGMAFPAGVLLMYLPEEHAFRCGPLQY
jgi:hypothetical protein